jgi:hypothetical protein
MARIFLAARFRAADLRLLHVRAEGEDRFRRTSREVGCGGGWPASFSPTPGGDIINLTDYRVENSARRS